MGAAIARLRVPHVFVLLTGVILLCSLLTYLIPSGEYQRETRLIEGAERSRVVPDTYTPKTEAHHRPRRAVQAVGWWMAEMAGGFLLIGFVTIAIARLPLHQAARAFVKGLEDRSA
jgi:uncharacterized ion transporter superfamily protein YfcC